MRKKLSFFNLRAGKPRQSWNKYNLYNIHRHRDPNKMKLEKSTFFQQKWMAKAAARGYHGEQVREKAWRKKFNPTLRSVLPVDASHLAQTDGSEFAAGRGSGLDGQETTGASKNTPYTNMVFAALERRLDVAIHRAMFASSAKQARQFVIHGYVKVNGRKMLYPGYQLNPGDMFQVDPDRVMYATGEAKDAGERRAARRERKAARAAQEKSTEGEEETPAAEPATAAASGKEAEGDEAVNTTDPSAEALKNILEKARELLADQKDVLSARKKRTLRELQRSVRKAVSRGGNNKPLEEAVDEQMITLMRSLNVDERDGAAEEEEAASETEASGKQWVSATQKEEIRQALAELRDNPIDLSKPYATPWRPRAYMAPFAFIPRYLEVHHKVCSAVYVRHPVARPGMAEVPTPFGAEVNRLTHSWYLRNR